MPTSIRLDDVPAESTDAVPAILYKHRTFNQRAFEVLINREFWCADPATLNDPLDCQIDLNAVLRELIDRSESRAQRELLELLQKLTVIEKTTGKAVPRHVAASARVSSAGILSFTKNPTDALLWSHYASGHSGFCIGVSGDYIWRLLKNHAEYKIAAALSVSYSDVPPFDSIFSEYAAKLRDCVDQATLNKFNEKYLDALLVNAMVCKSNGWKYESEFRVIRYEKGPLKFSADDIKEVIFGAKAREVDIATIRQLLRGLEWQHLVFRQATFQPGKFQLLIDDL
jgi:hypothetical protein